MKFKACTAFKAASDTDDGVFEAIVSVFGNVDSWGDVVLPGAFAETLADWKASGDPIPVLWSHRMDDPRFSIGAVLDAEEVGPHDSRIPEWADQWVKDHGGLWVRGQLHTGPDASDIATAGRKLLRMRLVKQFSYAYDVVDGGWGEVNGQDVYELRKLKLYEVSPTQVGANDLTQLLAAKAADLLGNDDASDIQQLVRAAATMDAAQLRKAIALLGKAVALKEDGEPTDGGPVKGEEHESAKPEEPARLLEGVRLSLELLELETAVL